MPIPIIIGAGSFVSMLVAGLSRGLIRAGVPALIWLFKSKLGYFVAAAFLWLGMNWATLNIVLGPTLDLVRGYAESGGGFGGQGGDLAAKAAQWGGVLNLDKALTMVLSAYVTRNGLLNARLYLFKRGVGA